MRYWFPFPFLSLGLLTFWVLISQSTSPGTLLLGGILSVALAWAMVNLSPHKTVPGRVRPVFRLVGAVAVDIVRSNIAVLKVMLGRRGKPATAGFLQIELTLTDENAIAVLACILTATPGTAWLEFDRTSRRLTLHILDTADGMDWQHIIKTRYERPLAEIFQ
ncbi:Na+/H+ antiporter subunit E [Xaviernesmea oryzae]|uniref:Na+/H+ antiporter subunit E n=1 Tax=Xaviernesmea oryzae TaxID=464029 RepID=A0A1Q9AZ41_9HYPH|nr:Na+/H+ antiporter subunit E [Xaviernesmea oryzae]OLP60960.1 Na+/H+ antiporter subunit E [Xaviernesmea oryzae]SEL19981.1 multicomponent K+:H+ antiporter subunit E [Xaviernesmea oryzae]